MAYKVIRTDAFQRDLDAAVGYLVLSLENRSAAVSLLEDVEKCYDALERMPMMYEACHDSYLNTLGYRRAGVHNYVMVYKVNEEWKTVTLMRFFHGKQDYERLL